MMLADLGPTTRCDWIDAIWVRASDLRICAGHRGNGGESACTPDSVPAVPENRRWRPSLSAGGCPPAPAAYPGVSTDGPSSPCVALLPVGFAEPPGSPRVLVRPYRTVSPLPVRGRSGDRSRHRRFALCGTFLRVAPTGCYPAPCPVESGRSSDRSSRYAAARPAHHQSAILPARRPGTLVPVWATQRGRALRRAFRPPDHRRTLRL